MNQLVTIPQNAKTVMRQKLRIWKTSLMMRAVFLALCAVAFVVPAKAQNETLKMTNGTRQVPSNGFIFYDSGGPLLFDPAVDPANANEYNWTTWYQHNEDYRLTLTVPEGKGVKVEFSKLLINNDFLYFYEGDVVDEANLISILTCNEYSSSLDDFSVISHGNMTIRFVSDQRWRDEGWVATITQTDAFVPQPPVAVMAACSNQMLLIPTCNADAGGTMPMQYKLGSDGAWTDYTTTGTWIDLSSQTFPLTVTTRTKIDEGSFSSENTFTFNQILPPGVPGKEEHHDVNKVTVFFPNKPAGVNDTYYIRWTINNNPTTANENPLLWEQVGHEFQQPNNTPNTVPAGDIDYTDVDLEMPFYIHFATRGTTCPDLFSGVVTVAITQRYVPMPTISFTDSGSTTLECSLEGAEIYYTTNGNTPTDASIHYPGESFTVPPGTTVKAIAIKEGYITSVVASAIFIPGGEDGGNGVYGDIVLLDDREDHSWSYYSDGDQPIHSLKPADVKISYYGNGLQTVSTTNGANPANDSWTADATGVQVGPNESGNQFIYLKTLENANEDGSGNADGSRNYPYTTIPNPFSKRPVYTSVSYTASTQNIYISTVQDNAYGYIYVTYTDENNQQQQWDGYINWSEDTGNIEPSTTITVKTGTVVTFRLTTIDPDNNWGTWVGTNGNHLVGYEARYDNAAGETISSGSLNYSGGQITNTATVEAAVAVRLEYTKEGTGSWYNGANVSYQYTDPLGNVVGPHYLTEGNANDITDYAPIIIDVKPNSIIYLTAHHEGGANAYSITAYNNVSNEQIAQAKTQNGVVMDANASAMVSSGGTTTTDWRGFYAWRVKRLSNGVKIKVNGTEYGSDQISAIPFINAETPVEFVTTNEYGNEVDFEALWAKAYVVRYTRNANVTVSNQSVGFERNFVVLARNNNDFTLGGGNNRLNNPYNRAVTISSYNPDGTLGANGCGIDFGGDLDLNYDLKLEYVQNFSYANSTYYINANGHYLCIGRGMTTNYTIAAQINAIRGNAYTLNASNTKIRIESGNYGHIHVLAGQYGYTNQSGQRFHTLLTFGTDYDRATKDNNKLTVAPSNGEITFGNRYPLYGENGDRRINASVNRRERTFTCITKSGKFQEDQFENTVGSNSQSFYIGTTGESNSYSGKRYLTVEGGEFACIAGGRGPKASGDDNTYPTTTATYVDRNDTTATIRIKKDAIIHGGIYGGAAASAAWGNRKIIITGGTIEGWVAGGCNGTSSNTDYGGRGIGDSYIYVGGNAVIGGETPNTIPVGTDDLGIPIPGTIGGNVFGAGRGSFGGPNVPSSMDNSYVVIADHCDILHSVYGGGNLGRVFEGEGHAANVYILGGTIHEDVYGGANLANSQMAFVHIKDGVVEGSVYGGSNTEGTANGLAQINMSGGSVGGSVFGGGYGVSTNMNAGTEVNISGGTINNNVYGGGEEGTVTSNTNVNFSGGTVQNVFGAGKGSSSSTALVSGQTHAMVSGGTVKHCVYGGGEAGDVNNGLGNLASTVVISGGTVEQDVFGGGRLGKTTGNVIVNMYDGVVGGSVFGGAFGSRDNVYIAGTHTVNIMGGNIYTNVYGGSRQADDALSFTPTASDAMVNCVNISGGHIFYQVFAGGFFGHNYGSVYALIGQNAIFNAPYHFPTDNLSYSISQLIIDGSVWTGADFGAFDGSEFGAATIDGRSNVYIDGLGYNTVSTQPSSAGYMNIGTSVLGVGTSCYAGERSDLIFRNYGQTVDNPNFSKDAIVEPYTSATRNLKSIQFFNEAVIEKAHVHFIGQGRINSLLTTEKYALYEVKEVMRVTNGSSLFIDFPIDQMMKMGSYTCPDVYAATPTFTKVDYNQLSQSGKDNKFRINAGAFINVKYMNGYGDGKHYGEFEGFFYVMTDDENSVCAYARPKQSTDPGNEIDSGYDNPYDGGFLSYHSEYNIYDLQGGTDGTGIQMPYENHTLGVKAGEMYFRIWRYGGLHSYRQGVFNAVAQPSTNAGYSTTDVLINLPAARGDGSFYRIKTVGGFPLVDYGGDVLTVNAGVYNSTNDTPASNGWMYYNSTTNEFVYNLGDDNSNVSSGLDVLHENVNANFGLVAIPQGSLVGSGNNNWLICNDASDENELLTTTQWTNYDQNTNPSILFRLTYYNQLTNNVVWDPITIIFEQCVVDSEGNVIVKDEVEVALSVSTSTTIEQNFTAQTFALMDGTGTTAYNTFTAKVVLPSYFPSIQTPGELSNWVFKSAVWSPNDTVTSGNHIAFDNDSWTAGSGYTSRPYESFSMEIQPSYNFDNTLGWTSFDPTSYDLKNISTNTLLSSTDGRNNAAFDFILHYDRRVSCNDEKLMGVLRVILEIDNFKGTPNNKKEVIIDVEVWRRGIGRNYYIDGVNGNNYYNGTFPDAAKRSLSGIFNHSDYKPGDNIFIVNTVTADGNSTLDWNGQQYGQVLIYRYPGGHPLSGYNNTNECYLDYSDYYPGNMGFAGPLVQVETTMDIHGIILDGAQTIHSTYDYYLYPMEDDGRYVTPTAPLVSIAEDAVLTVYGQSGFQWNYSNGNGGAIYNAGTMYINDGSFINNNAVLSSDYNGAGVYLKDGSTLIVSDLVNITNNHVVTHTGNATSDDPNNNVYLVSEGSVIQVGTLDPNDVYDQLDNASSIGVTKGDWGRYYYTPIAYSEVGSDVLENLMPEDEEAPAEDYLIFDDGLYYHLVTLNNTETYEPSSNYLFWVGTWVTAVHSKPSTYTEVPNGGTATIHNSNDLAWAISVVNGLNKHEANPNTNFIVTADIDMAANIWVPIGTNNYPYTGTFDAQGHVITGVHSPLNSENMGTFGIINGGTVENMIVSVDFSGGNSVNMGGVAAVVNGEGSTISNVEAAGNITGTSTTEAIGGIVAVVNPPTGTNPDPQIIGNVFSVATMTATNPETHIGGLVGDNAADLINSYANATMSGSDHIGGLVSMNKGHIENCYSVIGEQTFPAFADVNVKNDDFTGVIKICYTDTPYQGKYVNSNQTGAVLDGYGTYGSVLERKAIGYMYYDNAIGTIIESDSENPTNVYTHGETIDYTNNHKINWNGLLWSLNRWVSTNPDYPGCTPWFRPTSGEINGDLPILGFPMDNCLGTTDADGKFLQYGSIVNANGLDHVLVTYNDNMDGAASSLFLYGEATGVNNVPKSNVRVYINEDAVLKQSSTAGDFINTVVGITFDNSCRNSYDYWGNQLLYDWHMMSTPLKNAKMGTEYSEYDTDPSHSDPALNWGDVTQLNDSYFPNGLMASGLSWDFYCYYEPQYHWINFKRDKYNHFHYDEISGEHANIVYDGLDQGSNDDESANCVFTPGKGYMMAISQDSYMSSQGVLNRGGETVAITNQEPTGINYNKGWNLVGNPYQAYLDLDDVASGLTMKQFYIYDADQDMYVPYTYEQSKNTVTPSRYIHPHQAFFMYASTTTDFEFNYAWAKTKPTDEEDIYYFRDTENRLNYPLVNLFAENQRGNRDLAIIEFNRPELGGATKVRGLRNANFRIAASMAGVNYGILFTPEGTEKVPVSFQTEQDGIYTLTWDMQNGDFTSLRLVDNKTGVNYDMLSNDSYTFEASADDYASRFYITYAVTGVEEGGVSCESGSFAFYDGSEWVVNGKGRMDVVDMTGRVLLEKQLDEDQSRVNLDGLAKGVYLLRVVDNNVVRTQKVIVR